MHSAFMCGTRKQQRYTEQRLWPEKNIDLLPWTRLVSVFGKIRIWRVFSSSLCVLMCTLFSQIAAIVFFASSLRKSTRVFADIFTCIDNQTNFSRQRTSTNSVGWLLKKSTMFFQMRNLWSEWLLYDWEVTFDYNFCAWRWCLICPEFRVYLLIWW